ncbi:MAG: protein-L-isoaspartate O-methyltransferase [Alphaproteobacteria bacterium]|jgi:protein-L-isoaspartate(D-aspartate) O-methyltransferase|nr:protein-L-isoaspartate O-methyltransferase [Alphaproteobacteria bacterium]MBT5860200.1 protein-L-isoaspartate O-methyltransferase [Alphaproteobacteria bacterium]
MSDFEAARRSMVDSQLRPNQVVDVRVAEAMAEVPREMFVPDGLADVAYVDEDLPIAPGRFLMEPVVFARLLQAAAIEADDVVLDLGCGSGYSTAVLARLAATVVAMEPDADLRDKAEQARVKMAADNAVIVDGDLTAGTPGQGPFDVIFLNGAVEQIPDGLRDQLADGGRLVAVHNRGGVGVTTVLERQGERFSTRELFDAAIPLLPGFAKSPGFVF